MAKPEFLVLGAGGMGPGLAAWLARRTDPRLVMLAEKDPKRLAQVTDFPGLDRINVIDADIESESFRACMFRGRTVISAVPARFSPLLAASAIQAGTSFCDLGGDRNITQSMRSNLHRKAQAVGVSVVPDCGLAPGLGDILAVDLARRGATDITIYVGGIPKLPVEEAGNYQRVFSLEGLKLLLNPAQVLVDGVVTLVEPYDGLELLNVPALERFNTGFGGAVEAFTTDGIGTAAWFMSSLGVKNFREKTVRWPGFVKFIKAIPPDRFIPTLERILPSTDAEHPDLVWMRVVGRTGSQEMSWELLDTYDPVTGFSAMTRTTGFSAAAVALAVAKRKTRIGVLPPEEALDAQGIQDYLVSLAPDLSLAYAERTI